MSAKRNLVCLSQTFITSVLLSAGCWLADGLQATTLTWNSANGDWQTADNWSPAQVPTANDTVNIGSGTVTVTTAAQFATLNFGGGTLSGTLIVTNGKTMNWTSGTLAGDGALTVATNGQLSMSTAGGKYLYGALTNAGTVVWSGNAVWYFGRQRPARIVNLASGLFEVQNDTSFSYDGAGGSGRVVFDNYGTFRKRVGTGTTTFDGYVAFNNAGTGTVDVQSGILSLSGGGTLSGTLLVPTGGTLVFAGGTFAPGGSAPAFAGDGVVRVSGGAVTANLASTVLQWEVIGGDAWINGTLTNLNLSGGYLRGTNTLVGTMSWTAGYLGTDGALTIAPLGQLTLSTAGGKYLYGSLTNAGTVVWAGTAHWYYGRQRPTRVVNLAGGLFEALNDVSFAHDGASGSGSVVFDNYGTFRKRVGTGTTTFDGYVAFSNTGTIEALSGTLAFNGGYSMAGGGVTFGFSSATDFGKVTVSGAAPLTNALGARLLGDYVPTAGAAFQVMTFGSYTGGFTDTNGLNVGSQRYFEPAYTATTLTLTARFTNNVPPTPVPLPANCVAWWRAENNFLDSVGTNQGVGVGGVTFAPGEVGQAFGVNGTTSFVTISNSASLQLPDAPFSTAVWFKTDSSADQILLSKGIADSNEEYSISWFWGSIMWDYGDGNAYVKTAGTPVPNQWYHLEAIYDPALSPRGRVYVNGVMQPLVASGPNAHIANSGSDLYLGSQRGGQLWQTMCSPFSGLIDEVAIFNRALSSNEIAAIYAAGSAGMILPATGPSITTQPQSVTNAAGATVQFTVTATGTAPLSYQWRKGGVPLANGGSISGATSNVLTLASVQLTDMGNYTVVVTNSVNSITSAVAVLTVTSAPVAPQITSQPQSKTNLAGATVTFTVAATGTPTPGFQWRRGGTNLSNAGNISGVTTATLTLTNLSAGDAGSYTVVAANSAGAETSAPPAVLTVAFPPSITTPPQNLTVGVGSNATFSVVAGGTAPLSYQWRRGGTAISGATATSYTLSNAQLADSLSQFDVVVTNAWRSITSAVAVLTVTNSAVAPQITSQPQSRTIGVGTTVQFTVTATGERAAGLPMAQGRHVAGQRRQHFRRDEQRAHAGERPVDRCGELHRGRHQHRRQLHQRGGGADGDEWGGCGLARRMRGLVARGKQRIGCHRHQPRHADERRGICNR